MRTLLLVLFFTMSISSLKADELDSWLNEIYQVGPKGKNSRQAAQSWASLSKSDASQLPRLLASLDEANPLAANWIRSAIEKIVEDRLASGETLPQKQLENFLKETKQNPRARRLAFELVARVDDTAENRLIPGMLDDPSPELRRDAVARLIEQAEAAKENAEKPRLYDEAFTAAVDLDQVSLLAERLKELGKQVDVARHWGFVMRWHLVGPFDNKDEQGFHVPHGPEGKPIDLSATYKSTTGDTATWFAQKTDDKHGKVDINKALGKHKGATCYAVSFFHSEKDQPVQFRVKTFNACKLWLNGKLIDTHEVYHSGSQFDQYICSGQLKKGRNAILLKICQNEQTENWAQDWDFALRVCNSTGEAIISADRDTSSSER